MSTLEDWKWLHPPATSVRQVSLVWRVGSFILVAVLGLFTKFWMFCMNSTVVYNREILQNLVDRRDRGLLTVCNHHSTIDDPCIWSILSAATFFRTDRLRYTAADDKISFYSRASSIFMTLAKVFPVTRGAGVYQRGLDFMVDLLDLGHWCHIFPVGTFYHDNDFHPLEWGVGRVVADCQTTPVVLPIWHRGTETVLPVRPPYFPLRVGKKVTIAVGQPIDLSHHVTKLKEDGKSPIEMRKHLTGLIEDEMRELKERTDYLHGLRCDGDSSTSSSVNYQ